MAIQPGPNWRQQALLGGFALLLGLSYWQSGTSSGLPLTSAQIHVPQVGQQAQPTSATQPAPPSQAQTKKLLTAFFRALFTHDAQTYAAQLTQAQSWADSGAVNAVRREFALEGLPAYYQQHQAAQVNQVDSLQIVSQAAGRYAARVFSHSQILQAGCPVRSYPVVAILTLKTVPVMATNPYGRHITSFRFTQSPNYPVLDTRFQ